MTTDLHTVAPAIDSTPRHFPGFPIHLARGDGDSRELFLIGTAHWHVALQLAYVGGWRPEGARQASSPTIPVANSNPVASAYAYAGRYVLANDAARFARGLRAVLATPRVRPDPWRSVEDCCWIDDPRLSNHQPAREFQAKPIALRWFLEDGDEVFAELATFAERGAFETGEGHPTSQTLP